MPVLTASEFAEVSEELDFSAIYLAIWNPPLHFIDHVHKLKGDCNFDFCDRILGQRSHSKGAGGGGEELM